MEKEEKSSSNDDEFKVGEEGGGGVFSSLHLFKQDDTFRQVLKNKKVKKRFIIYFE